MGSNNNNDVMTQAGTLSQDSSDNYYTISTTEEYITLCNNSSYWDKKIKMVEDIEIKDRTFTPIGGTTPFSGIFDGQGHTITISNSTCSYTTGESDGVTNVCLGIFGCMVGGKVINLKVHYNMSSYCYSYNNSTSDSVQICSGGIVAYVMCGKVKNCMVTGKLMMNIQVPNYNGRMAIGALVGRGDYSPVRNCAFTGEFELNVKAYSTANIYKAAGVGIAQGSEFYSDPEGCGDIDTLTNTILNFSVLKYTINDNQVSKIYCANYLGGSEYTGSIYFNNVLIGTSVSAHNDDYLAPIVPPELKYNKEAFLGCYWSKSAEWDFDNTWTFVKGVNDDLPVLRVFSASYTSSTTEMTITGTVECANSMLLLTLVDENEKIVQEISFVTGQVNSSAKLELAKNKTYKILATRPFGSCLDVELDGVVQTPTTYAYYLVSTADNDAMSMTFTLTGGGMWKNCIVI